MDGYLQMSLETGGGWKHFCSGWAELVQGRHQQNEDQKTEKHGPFSIECAERYLTWKELGETSQRGGYETIWDNLGTGFRLKENK